MLCAQLSLVYNHFAKKDLSFIYPLSAGCINVLSVVMGVFFLKETISYIGIAGIFFTILGIILLNI